MNALRSRLLSRNLGRLTTPHAPRTGFPRPGSMAFYASAPSQPEEQPKPAAPSFWDRLKTPEAPQGFNRMRMIPGAVATHLCLGSVYAWSLFNSPLTHELGVIIPASGDWSLSSVVPVFSAIMMVQGISAALFGTWQEKVGPRAAGLVGAGCFGGGLLVGGMGVITHNLPLLYAGYGLLGGIGIGMSYVPPVAMLIRWFPDKKGLATGLTVMGFGGGALVATPILNRLFEKFSKIPDYLGTPDAVDFVAGAGRRMANVGGEIREVVVASAHDAAQFGGGLDAGVYLAGTGSTGAGMALTCLGTGFLVTMTAGALSYRNPPADYPPALAVALAAAGKADDEAAAAAGVADADLVATGNVHVNTAMRTPQFWQQWVTFGCLTTAGMSVVSVAKNMMHDIFGAALPGIVTPAFASSYIMAISLFNLGGRVGWSALSDKIGRKNTFSLFVLASIPLYAGIPSAVDMVSANPSTMPLAVFYGSTLMLFSFFGGAYATMPAYEADLFGTKFVGAIHGRMLTASACAALVGPVAITKLRAASEFKELHKLADSADATAFEHTFGAPMTELDELIQAKTVTIPKLLELCPPGTVDPTPFLYNSTMYGAAGLLTVAVVSNLAIRPVDKKFYIESRAVQAATDARLEEIAVAAAADEEDEEADAKKHEK